VVESIRELRKITQAKRIALHKGRETISYSWAFGRKFSIYFTKLFLYTGISANHITVLNFFIGLAAGALFTLGQPVYMLLAAMLAHIWWIIDYTDGEVARYRKSTCVTSAYLDDLTDCAMQPILLMCITFGLYSIFRSIAVFVFGFLSVIGILLISTVSMCKYEAVLHKWELAGLAKKVRGGVSKLRGNRKGRESVKESEFKSYLPRSVFIVFNHILHLSIAPGILHVMFAAALIDLVIPQIALGWPAFNWLTFNFMYLFLILYGIFSQFIWIGLAAINIKLKSADMLYNSLSRS